MYIKDLSAVKTMGLIGGDTYTNSLNKVNYSTFLNNWVFNNQSADGYIDLSGLNDYQDPAKLKSKYTTDGVHLTKEGQKALVDLIDVSKLLKE